MFLDLVRQRSSCRAYLPKPVEREKIERCLEAARLAPSACNSQPWRFIVVADPATRARLAEAAFSGVFGMNAFARTAPVLVVVVREASVYTARLGATLRGVEFSLMDLGIACDHFTLQAAEEGLGTCWLGWFNGRAVKKIFGWPRRTRVDVMLSLGYPMNPSARDKCRKTLDEIREWR